MTTVAAEDLAPLERFRERLRLFAARRLRDWTEAEDVAQEALRRGLEAQRSGRIEKPESLSSFLYQTTLHICQNRLRDAGREAHALRRFDPAPPSAEGTEDPLQDLLTAERREAVRRGLEKLGSEDRDVLLLSYADALGAEEIAQRLRTTAGNVRVRRHRALRRLAELLGVTVSADRVHERRT